MSTMNLMRQASDMLFLATSVSKTLHQEGPPYAHLGVRTQYIIKRYL